MKEQLTSLSPELIEKGLALEEWSYFPDGKRIDGAVYTASASAISFILELERHLGNGSLREGSKILLEEVVRLGGDPECGNWHLTASFSLCNIPLRTE